MKKRFQQVLRNTINNSEIYFEESMWLYFVRNVSIGIVCGFITGIIVTFVLIAMFLK